MHYYAYSWKYVGMYVVHMYVDWLEAFLVRSKVSTHKIQYTKNKVDMFQYKSWYYQGDITLTRNLNNLKSINCTPSVRREKGFSV